MLKYISYFEYLINLMSEFKHVINLNFLVHNMQIFSSDIDSTVKI